MPIQHSAPKQHAMAKLAPTHRAHQTSARAMSLRHYFLQPAAGTMQRCWLNNATLLVSLFCAGFVLVSAGLCRFRCFVLVLQRSLLVSAGFAVLCWFCAGLSPGLCRFRCFVLVLCWSLLVSASFAVLCWFCNGLCWSLSASLFCAGFIPWEHLEEDLFASLQPQRVAVPNSLCECAPIFQLKHQSLSINLNKCGLYNPRFNHLNCMTFADIHCNHLVRGRLDEDLHGIKQLILQWVERILPWVCGRHGGENQASSVKPNCVSASTILGALHWSINHVDDQSMSEPASSLLASTHIILCAGIPVT